MKWKRRPLEKPKTALLVVPPALSTAVCVASMSSTSTTGMGIFGRPCSLEPKVDVAGQCA